MPTFAASLPWLSAYRVAALPGILAGASVLPVVIEVLVGWRRPHRLMVTTACSLAGLAAFLGMVVGAGPGAVASGLIRGPSYLVTDTLPLGGPRSLLGPAIAVTWTTAAVVAGLIARALGQPAQGAARALGHLAMAVLVASYVGAYAVSSSAPRHEGMTGALMLGAMAALALTISRMSPSPVPARRVMGGAGFVAVVALVAWSIVPGLPGLASHQKRAISLRRQAPLANPMAISPVDAIASLRDGDPKAAPRTVMTVTTNAPSTGYLAIADLDLYDGATWSFDRTFQPTGGRVPAPPQGTPGTSGTEVRQDYRMDRSLGPTLPFVAYLDRPVQVAGKGAVALDADAVTGMVVPVRPVAGDARYSVTSVAPARTLSGLPESTRLQSPAGDLDRQMPPDTGTDIGSTLAYLASLTGQTPAPTVSFLGAMVAALGRTDRRIDPLAPALPAEVGGPAPRGGTSLSEVIAATTIAREATPEQFATLFVVVARSLGVAARLVTGFRVAPADGGPRESGQGPSGPGAGARLPAGTYRVTNRDAWTWAEVPVAGLGWIVVDPTPSQVATGLLPSPVPAALTTPTTQPPESNAVGRGGGHALAPATPIHLPPSSPPSLLVALWGIAGATLAAIAIVLGVPAGRRRTRRWRRRRGRPEEMAVGAWLELLDDLNRAGLQPSGAATSKEVADLAGQSWGPAMAAPVQRVGSLADQALCSQRSGLDADTAVTAWNDCETVRLEVRRQSSIAQRARGALHVGTQPPRPVA